LPDAFPRDASTFRDISPIALKPCFRYQRPEVILEGIPAMADNTPTGPVELGGQMDYQEHEKTYALFGNIVKYGTVSLVALLAAMAFGFFTAAGFFSATILFILLVAAGSYLLR